MIPDALAGLPPIVAARAMLDDALVAARALDCADVPAAPVVEALAEALRSVYEALGSLGDAHGFHDAREAAAESARDALVLLQPSVALEPAVVQLTRSVSHALQLLLAAPLPVLDPAPVLPHADDRRPVAQATTDEPRLLDLRRGVMQPAVPVSEPPGLDMPAPEERDTQLPPAPAPDMNALRQAALASLRALDAKDDAPPAPPPAPAPEAPLPWDAAAGAPLARAEKALFGERVAETDVVFERARDCLEDLGALGLARRPMESEPWWCPRTEARMLARIDALAACREVVAPWLVQLLADRPVPDPELTWALILFFGCVAGDDAIDQAMRLARITPAEDPELRASLADAFTHTPHPGLFERLRPWLSDPSPGRRAVALVALGRRGSLTLAQIAPHLRDPEAFVARAAVEALGASSDGVAPDALAAALARPEAEVFGAALDLAVRCEPGLALWHAMELVRVSDPDRGDAAMHVALGAGDEGLAILHAADELTPVGCEALGWYGHATSVAPLLQALIADDELTVAGAAAALWRITGAPLTDDDPDPALDVVPFTDATWEDDGLPEAPPELSIDPALWTVWWEAHGANADPSVRWRFGRRWRVDDNVRVLAAKTSRPRDRRWAALELVARTGRTLSFDAWRFIPRQLEQIAAWREVVRGRTTLSAWPVAGGSR